MLSSKAKAKAYSKKEIVLIIGAGVFGLTTALELRERGFENVTVLDRYAPPVPDGSSVDISRVIRFDYGDPLYAKMALEAMRGWEEQYASHFHRCGFLMISDDPCSSYIRATKAVLRSMKQSFQELPDEASMRRFFPEARSELGTMHGYANPRGGWANAEGAIRQLAAQCSEAGVSIISGPRGSVLHLGICGGKISEVHVAQGPPLQPDHVILATGAWSSRLIDTGNAIVATAQPLASVAVSPEEVESLKNIPICINVASGFFLFPPNQDGHLKVVRHGFGYENRITVRMRSGQVKDTSSPIFDHNGAAADFLPQDAEKSLRQGLETLLPQLADRPFINRRLCWYTDTPKGDFILDDHPELSNLFFAIGGSGQYVDLIMVKVCANLLFQCLQIPPSLGQIHRGLL